MGKRDVTVTVEGPMSSEADAVDDLRTQLAAANIDAANLEAEKNDLVAQLAAAGQERDEARDAARVIGGLRVAGEQKYRALLVENRVLRDRFFAVRELVAPYRYTDYAAIAAWPLLEVIPDAPLTTAEAERVKRMEGELRNCIGALTRRRPLSSHQEGRPSPRAGGRGRMLSRTELQERLQALSGDLCQRDDLVWACVRREREALETALWLAERAEWLARSDGDCPDCPSYGDDCRDDEGLIPCVGPSCELRTWLQREATDD